LYGRPFFGADGKLTTNVGIAEQNGTVGTTAQVLLRTTVQEKFFDRGGGFQLFFLIPYRLHTIIFVIIIIVLWDGGRIVGYLRSTRFVATHRGTSSTIHTVTLLTGLAGSG
jgi:hypothetical protein